MVKPLGVGLGRGRLSVSKDIRLVAHSAPSQERQYVENQQSQRSVLACSCVCVDMDKESSSAHLLLAPDTRALIPPKRRTPQEVRETLPIHGSSSSITQHGGAACHNVEAAVVAQQEQDEIQRQKLHRFYTVAEEYLARRQVEVQATHKCPDCWFPIPSDQNEIPRCICDELHARLALLPTAGNGHTGTIQPQTGSGSLLTLSINARIIIYMHHLEWMNGGNSGKLLLKCFNHNDGTTTSQPTVQLFVYGRRADDAKLKTFLEESCPADYTALLFPSADAITVTEFWNKRKKDTNTGNSTKSATHLFNNMQQLRNDFANQVSVQSQETIHQPSPLEPAQQLPPPSVAAKEPPLTLVVVDATYKKAKNMVKHFHKRILPKDCIQTVKLDLDAMSENSSSSSSSSSTTYTSSIFARAQKSYGKRNGSGNHSMAFAPTASSSATNQGRVCTVEAVAYALRECGERQETVNGLLEAIRVNNEAAKYYLHSTSTSS